MKRALAIAVMIVAGAALLRAGDIVDRIIVTVNGQPILLSDWDVSIRYEAFLDQRPLPLPDEAARAVLDRLIDQELLREQMRTSHWRAVQREEVAARLDVIRQATTGGDTEPGMRAALAKYGLSEAELAERVQNQLEILHFIDARLRPAVHVDRRSIEAYYNATLLPELRQKGAREVPLAEVSGQIEELLSQQRVDGLLSDWLKEMRQHSQIEVDLPAPAPAASSTAEREKP